MKIVRTSYRHYAGRAALALAVVLGVMTGRQAMAETLVLGTVGKDLKNELKEHQGLADYLRVHLAASGIDQVQIVITPTAAKMSEALKAGSVHLYFESPLVAAKIVRDGNAVPLLRRWRKGVGEYWSEIIVPKNSPIQTLEDLRGQVIAFDDPDSTSGHLLPRAMLLERGLEVEILSRPGDRLDPAKVGGTFTLSDKASILMMIEGRVAAVATDPQYVQQIEKEVPGSVRTIASSITVPRHVVLRSVTLSEERAERIAGILKTMHETEEGRSVLAKSGRTSRFDAFPDGIEATFAPLNNQLRMLEAASAPVMGTQ